MMFKLPISEYQWMGQAQIDATDFAHIDISKDYGFIAEVDLEVKCFVL